MASSDYAASAATYVLATSSSPLTGAPTQPIQIYKTFSLLVTGSTGAAATAVVYWSPNNNTAQKIQIGTLSATIGAGVTFAWDYTPLTQFCAGSVWAQITSVSGGGTATVYMGVSNA